MTKIEITTGSRTIIYKIVKEYSIASMGNVNHKSVTYDSYKYTEDYELAEIRKMMEEDYSHHMYTVEEMIIDDDGLNVIVNADNWSA